MARALRQVLYRAEVLQGHPTVAVIPHHQPRMPGSNCGTADHFGPQRRIFESQRATICLKAPQVEPQHFQQINGSAYCTVTQPSPWSCATVLRCQRLIEAMNTYLCQTDDYLSHTKPQLVSQTRKQSRSHIKKSMYHRPQLLPRPLRSLLPPSVRKIAPCR